MLCKNNLLLGIDEYKIGEIKKITGEFMLDNQFEI